MVLVIDVGNTHIVIGGFNDDRLSFTARLSSNPRKTDAEYAAEIKSILGLYNIEKGEITGAIISSVVPPLTSSVKNAVNMVYGINALTVGPGVKTGINLLVDNPSQVGADLICSCVSAHEEYDTSVLIIDMGTATKIIAVDEKGSFLGVSIIPGVELSLKALTGGTAQLPEISLDAPKRILGKNTVECMKSGVIFGNASLIDGMIDKAEKELNCQPILVATGGLAKAIVPHCSHKILIDDNLILKGLYLIYKKNN